MSGESGYVFTLRHCDITVASRSLFGSPTTLPKLSRIALGAESFATFPSPLLNLPQLFVRANATDEFQAIDRLSI